MAGAQLVQPLRPASPLSCSPAPRSLQGLGLKPEPSKAETQAQSWLTYFLVDGTAAEGASSFGENSHTPFNSPGTLRQVAGGLTRRRSRQGGSAALMVALSVKTHWKAADRQFDRMPG